MQAADVMTRRIISVSPEARVETAIELMLKNKISGLPVIDAEGRICGIVTEGDLHAARKSAPNESDRAGSTPLLDQAKRPSAMCDPTAEQSRTS
jgi:CBS domain-containing protein